MSEPTPVDRVRDILRAHGLPERLLPDNVVAGDHDPDTGAFRVVLDRPVDRDVGGIPVRYAATITGRLADRAVEALEGVRAKKFVWLRVDAIRATGDELVFSVGPVQKKLAGALFD